jgi:purine-nucleoside phosphorylase
MLFCLVGSSLFILLRIDFEVKTLFRVVTCGAVCAAFYVQSVGYGNACLFTWDCVFRDRMSSASVSFMSRNDHVMGYVKKGI